MIAAALVGTAILVLLHEAGHASMAQTLGLRWRPFARLPWKLGISVWVETPRQASLIAVAGPAANILAAVPLLFAGGLLFDYLAATSVLMATLPSLLDWAILRKAHSL